MEIILNSKFFQQLPAAQLAEKAQSLGYDGLDLCVRPGHPVNPDNVSEALPRAVAELSSQGLSCPLVTLPTRFTDPVSPMAEAVYAACAAADVTMIKIGYFGFTDGDDYWQRLEQSRGELAVFAQLSEKHGVKTCYHTHSGQCIGSNCAGLMHLIRDFDAAHVGAYIDFGHMALDGEDIAMGLSMVREYLCAIGVKDGFHAHKLGADPAYEHQFAKLGEGSVHWRTAVRALSEAGFAGPWSVHTEYEVDGSEAAPAQIEEMARDDVSFLRRLSLEL
jgi:sugar phosphate isomerase/epimerase